MNINPLYESYPDTIMVDGKNYKIETDFREWIRFIDMWKDNEISDNEKIQLSGMWFLEEIPNNFQEAIQKILLFINRNPESKQKLNQEKNDTKPAFSYKEDAGYIIAGFRQVYGIDISHIKYMHWWEFQFLFDGLPEDTEIKKRMYYRSIDASKIKDKQERNRIRSIQNNISLSKEVLSDYEIGQAF